MPTTSDFPRTVGARVAQREHEEDVLRGSATCGECHTRPDNTPLRRCTGCRAISYCSKDCQTKHWPTHKPGCRLVMGKGGKNDFLSSFDHYITVQMIIDAYRLRVQLDHDQAHVNHGIYYSNDLTRDVVWAEGDAIADFQRFIDLAEDAHVLPKWWTFDERMQCLITAVDELNEENIFKPVETQKFLVKYGNDDFIRKALLILAELVAGSDGKGPPTDNQEYDSSLEKMAELAQSTENMLKSSD